MGFGIPRTSIVDEIASPTNFQVMHIYINSFINSSFVKRITRAQSSQVECDKVCTRLFNIKSSKLSRSSTIKYTLAFAITSQDS